jgi:hypothetical protein
MKRTTKTKTTSKREVVKAGTERWTDYYNPPRRVRVLFAPVRDADYGSGRKVTCIVACPCGRGFPADHEAAEPRIDLDFAWLMPASVKTEEEAVRFAKRRARKTGNGY